MSIAIRSRARYQIEPEEEDGIIGSTTYHNDDNDNAVYNVDLQSSFLLLAAMLVSSFPAGSLGMLDQLPLELLSIICGFLDVPSLLLFRGVCRRAHGLVASNFKLKRLATHAATFLVALGKGGMAHHFSLNDLYSRLCSEKCKSCGCFAGFFQFPTARRCCFSCLSTSDATNITTRTDCRNILGYFSFQPLQSLPQFHSLPGTYAPWQNVYRGRYYCMSMQAALRVKFTELLVADNNGLPLTRRQINRGIVRLCRQVAPGRGRHSTTLTDILKRLMERPHERVKYRFMSTVVLPVFNERTQTASTGLSCLGCQEAKRRGVSGPAVSAQGFFDPERAYSREGFLDHFKWCELAQVMWRRVKAANALAVVAPGAIAGPS